MDWKDYVGSTLAAVVLVQLVYLLFGFSLVSSWVVFVLDVCLLYTVYYLVSRGRNFCRGVLLILLVPLMANYLVIGVLPFVKLFVEMLIIFIVTMILDEVFL